MRKNFLYFKTGHRTSDEYFKNLAIWHDVDILKFFVLGLCTGCALTVAIHLFIQYT